MVQLPHTASPFKHQKLPVVLISDGVSGPANLGALFRIAEAFGVEQLVLGKSSAEFGSARMKRTARNTMDRVPYLITDVLESCAERFRNEGYRLIALEITSKSDPLECLSIRAGDKVALILGNESNGVSPGMLALADNTYHIRLFGENSSINVAHAAAIALYELTKVY